MKYNIAWTLLILICLLVDIITTFLIHIFETKFSNKIRYGLFFVALQIFSIFLISKYIFPGSTNYGIDLFFKKHINLISGKNILPLKNTTQIE